MIGLLLLWVMSFFCKGVLIQYKDSILKNIENNQRIYNFILMYFVLFVFFMDCLYFLIGLIHKRRVTKICEKRKLKENQIDYLVKKVIEAYMKPIYKLSYFIFSMMILYLIISNLVNFNFMYPFKDITLITLIMLILLLIVVLAVTLPKIKNFFWHSIS